MELCAASDKARSAACSRRDRGTLHTLSVNSAGNFYLQSATFAYPYQAKVVYQGRERVMVEPQKSGDCNDCHTQAGTQNAPGRIFPP